MAAQTTSEKLERLESLRESRERDFQKLLYEWVKTGNLSLSEFSQALEAYGDDRFNEGQFLMANPF